MATRPPLMPPVNETEHSVSRLTRDGKKITYKLNVMQQPERARACGAGAKSSADRRPVDPPPVVELRVFESDPNDDLHKTDITFGYNANFFLYATLENARPIAQVRSTGPPPHPVLTGVPVAGVAYLDRPSQAGYFIFPDLSVRHEGRFRLNFHLYEEIKEAKDIDKDVPMPSLDTIPRIPSKPSAPQTYLHFRLEVKSVPFTVYSAKKFPGLATSTALSRVIAEQGCRVRIRRDVRMRRRGDKQTEDYDYEEERAVYARSDRYSTPDGYAATPVERPRSTSNSTIEPPFAYGPDVQRRPSAPEYGFQCPQPYQRPAPPGPSPSSHTPYPSHLSFGSTQAQYQTPQLPPTPQSTAPPASYSPHASYSHGRSQSNSSEYESPSVGYPYPQSRPQAERSSYPKTALPPLLLEPPKGLTLQPYCEPRSSDPNAYQSLTQSSTPRSQTPSNAVPSLPPLKVLSGEYANNFHQPLSSVSQSPCHETMPVKKFFYETGAALAKRSHEDSFGHEERPLQNGMRPDTESYPNTHRKHSEAGRVAFYGEHQGEMEYKRANGRMAMKIPPALQ